MLTGSFEQVRSRPTATAEIANLLAEGLLGADAISRHDPDRGEAGVFRLQGWG